MRNLSGREWFMVIGLLVIAYFIFFWDKEGLLGTREDEIAAAPEILIHPEINLEDLGVEPIEYSDARSLFAYGPKPRAKQPPRPPKRNPPEVVRPVTPPNPRPAPGPVTPPKAKPPRITFKYLGYLGPKEDRIAVFWEDEEMILARVGEVVKDHFKVIDFKYEKIVMGYTQEQFKDETTELAQQSK